MSPRRSRFLLACTVVLSTFVAGGALMTQAIGAQKAAFDEIDVRRINVREEDGTLRLIVSNTQRMPGIIVKGKEQLPLHTGTRPAGIIFFNEEGTENGGLLFNGRKQDGKVRSTGHLSFDRYEQDQVIQMTQSETDDSRFAAFAVSDRPDRSIDFEGLAKLAALPDGPAKEAASKKLIEGGSVGLNQRVMLGKLRDGSAALFLADAEGRRRIAVEVTGEGAAAIKFMDENGKVVRALTAFGDERQREPQ